MLMDRKSGRHGLFVVSSDAKGIPSVERPENHSFNLRQRSLNDTTSTSAFDRFEDLVPMRLLADHVVLAYQLHPTDVDEVSRWVEQLAGLMLRVPSQALLYEWLLRNAGRKTVVLVNCDAMNSSAALEDFGRVLRRYREDVVIVFMTSQVERDDFSTSRLNSCDVTLKNPTSPSAFHLGMGVAIDNHRNFLRDSLRAAGVAQFRSVRGPAAKTPGGSANPKSTHPDPDIRHGTGPRNGD